MQVQQRSQRTPRHPRRTQLQPLNTNPSWPGRRILVSPVFRSPGPKIPQSAISLASPTLIGVRQYYRDRGLTTALQNTPVARRGSVAVPPHYPRRHSSISSPGGLAARLGRVAVSSPLSSAHQLLAQARPRFESIAEESRKQLLDGVNGDERVSLGNVVVRRRSSIQPNVINQVACREPAEYTRQRLRHWGPAYFGNIGTSDVLVKAVYLMKSEPQVSLAAVTPSDTEDVSPHTASKSLTKVGDEGNDIIVRARVTPSTKDRKSFLIQRRFNLAEIRAKHSPLPSASQVSAGTQAESDDGQTAEAASHRDRVRAQSTPFPRPIEALPTIDAPPSQSLPYRTTSSIPRRSSSTPIHVEYAVQYLPVLAALMLSGHIRKGDVIELPIPCPEAWSQTVAWVYTGRPERANEAVVRNVRYLGGGGSF